MASPTVYGSIYEAYHPPHKPLVIDMFTIVPKADISQSPLIEHSDVVINAIPQPMPTNL